MKFDAIIIGTGQAGVPLAHALAGQGLSTAVIEKKYFGGTCVNTGCTPTKTYVGSARRAFAVNRSKELGISIDGQLKVDMKTIKARKDGIILTSRKGIETSLEENEHITLFKGKGHFIGPQKIQVNGNTLEGDRIFINVGTRPHIPANFLHQPYLTNEEMLELTEIPQKLLIVGGSYIGLEFAQIFRRFGSEVSIIEKNDRLISREDPDVSAAVKEILENEDIEIRLKANCLNSELKGDHISINVDCKEGAPTMNGTHLLLATGRVPNTDDLGLEAAGIEVNEKGYIWVNDQLETNVEGVWALGDCNGKGAFTHTSYNDYEIVAANLFHHGQRKVSDRILSYGLYIDPPLGRIGLTEKQILESGINAGIAKRPMNRIARAKEKGEIFGFMKVLVELETEKILGAAVLGVGGDEVVHSLLNLMYTESPYSLINRTVPIHPTVSELIPTTLENIEPLEELSQ